jgi:preprotein translocase subunit SecG
MYYGKQSSSNTNYYNAYRNDSYRSNNENNYLTRILKLLIIILFLGVLFVAYLSITNRAKPVETTIEKRIEVVKIEPIKDIPKKKEVVSINNRKKEKDLTPQEIASIIETVMSKMKQTAMESSENLKIDDDIYRKKLSSQDVDLIDSVNVKRVEKNSVSLKDTNYYNKVVINRPNNETYSNDTLSQLSSEIEDMIDNSKSKEDSFYTKEITKEAKVRSSEMRFIVVQEGDTLGRIAYRAYGNYDAYEKISQANPEIVFNPNQIYPGQRLRIPM